jgi:predicted DNA-binding transcriptional regulator AlpA
MITYLDIERVSQRYGITRRTVWRYVRQGIVPPPVYLSGRGSGARWRSDLLDEWDRRRDTAAPNSVLPEPGRTSTPESAAGVMQ